MCHIRLLDFKRWTGHAEDKVTTVFLSLVKKKNAKTIEGALKSCNESRIGDCKYQWLIMFSTRIKYFGTQYLQVQLCPPQDHLWGKFWTGLCWPGWWIMPLIKGSNGELLQRGKGNRVSFCPRVSAAQSCPESSVRMIDGYWCTYADCQRKQSTHLHPALRISKKPKQPKVPNIFVSFPCLCVCMCVSVGVVSTLCMMNMPPSSSFPKKSAGQKNPDRHSFHF